MLVKDFMNTKRSNHWVWIQYYSNKGASMMEHLYNSNDDNEEILKINIDFMKCGDPCFKLTIKPR